MTDTTASVVRMTEPEQVLEEKLVAQLVGQGFDRAAVTDEESMLANLKAQQYFLIFLVLDIDPNNNFTL